MNELKVCNIWLFGVQNKVRFILMEVTLAYYVATNYIKHVASYEIRIPIYVKFSSKWRWKWNLCFRNQPKFKVRSHEWDFLFLVIHDLSCNLLACSTFFSPLFFLIGGKITNCQHRRHPQIWRVLQPKDKILSKKFIDFPIHTLYFSLIKILEKEYVCFAKNLIAQIINTS